MRVFRRLFYKLVPRWLSSGDGEKVLASLGAVADMSLERMRSGMVQRFPSEAGDDALTLIGNERGVPRGRTEAKAHYVQRVKAWRWPRGHRTRGSAYALLEQVSEFFGGVACSTIDDAGNRHHRAADGTESHDVTAWNWDGQGLAYGGTATSRFWLILYLQPVISEWPDFDDGPWYDSMADDRDDDATIDGHGVSTEDIDAIRNLFKRTRNGVVWKPAGTRQMFAVVSYVAEGDTPPVAPDGTWGTELGRLIAAPSVLRFWDLA